MTTLFSNRYCLTCKTSVVYLHLIEAHTIPLNSTVDGPTEYKECKGPFTEIPDGAFDVEDDENDDYDYSTQKNFD